MSSGKCFPYRPHDYVYDPIFTVSGPTDHYKAAIAARMSTAKFQICPIFPNMFSDLPQYPRVQFVRRKPRPLESYRDKLEKLRKFDDPFLHLKTDVVGRDRSKFFYNVVNFPPKDLLPHQHHQTFRIEKCDNAVKTSKEKDVKINTIVETKYRESSAQTQPWQPPYVIIGKGDPELLKLDFLKWNCGLPAGIHEIKLIERARMRAAWEKATEPSIKDEQSLNRFRDYLEALEMDEWAFREKEINKIQELRLQLLEKMLNEIHQKSKTRTEMKMKNFTERKEAQKELLLQKIRKKSLRELRKLETKQRGLDTKYKEINIIDEHVDRKSELYGPLMRNGEHPKRWHQVVDEKLKTYQAQFIGVENVSTLPSWLNSGTKIKKRDLNDQRKGTQICVKESRWTGPVLRQLHEEMKNLRKELVKQPISLRTKVEHDDKVCFTPEVEEVPEIDEEKYQAAVTLQKLVRGRATQIMIYEGRDTCKELIKELKYSVGLLKKQKEVRTRHRLTVKTQQREECMQINMIKKLQGTLGKLQGSVVGTLLDFLNKELRRLFEERKVHAMCLLNERERFIREAAEAGRRQKELRRRREHDEMFKQIVKVTQESVDVYLQDVITEGMEFASREEATDYITKLADRIELETDEIYNNSPESIDEREESIANMVLHFLVPEIEKRIIRERLHLKQRENLRMVHDSIHGEFEDLPGLDETQTPVNKDELSSIKETETDSSINEHLEGSETSISDEIDVHDSLTDPIEAYLKKLEKSQEYVEDVFLLPIEQQSSNNVEYDMHIVNDSLDTIPEVSE